MTTPVVASLPWRKPSKSSGNNGNTCVEVALCFNEIAARDSKFPLGGILVLSRADWQSLLAEISGTD
ncbi:uncharacterized protein DUF397 [Stackebrandtia endophytica]|uniref:Uncharacterized protein DUF397 n=1 Tax=Stackebrandtia endophytica TaxID=1496996 RepID=A0A543ARD4_9ACTN|nr:DUF397 domain-containing protein [Stackebrandtia endophytica]TQL75140.1 uncharacterized protein DUF397 [Stackebrandtia endophytica]